MTFCPGVPTALGKVTHVQSAHLNACVVAVEAESVLKHSRTLLPLPPQGRDLRVRHLTWASKR